MLGIIIECDRPGAHLPRLYGKGTFAAWLVTGDYEWQMRTFEMIALCPDVIACLITPSKISKRAVRSVSDSFVQRGGWFYKSLKGTNDARHQ
jgi:hypothetical protein